MRKSILSSFSKTTSYCKSKKRKNLSNSKILKLLGLAVLSQTLIFDNINVQAASDDKCYYADGKALSGCDNAEAVYYTVSNDSSNGSVKFRDVVINVNGATATWYDNELSPIFCSIDCALNAGKYTLSGLSISKIKAGSVNAGYMYGYNTKATYCFSPHDKDIHYKHTQRTSEVNVSQSSNGNRTIKYNIDTQGITPYLILPKVEKAGYDFDGWECTYQSPVKIDNSANCSSPLNVIEVPANTNRDAIKMSDGWYIIYIGAYTDYAEIKANFSKKEAKKTVITFNANGGSGSMQTQTFTYGEGAKSLRANAYTRTGYTFAGWTCTVNGTTYEYSNAQAFTATQVNNFVNGKGSAVTLKAKWTPNECVVTFSGNGATSGTMATQTFVYNATEKLLRTNAYKRTGYTFKNWAKDTSSGTVYYDPTVKVKFTVVQSSTYANLSKSATTSEVKMKAQWTPNTTTIKFDANGGTGTMANQTFTYDSGAQSLKPNTFSKTGYEFTGWKHTDSSGTVRTYTNEQLFEADKVNAFILGKGSECTLVAQWSAATTTITFNANGGVGTMTNQTFTYDSGAQSLKANTFSREGYTFTGWTYTGATGNVWNYNDEHSFTATQINSFVSGKGSTCTLFAQWEPITYKIIFHANNGTSATSEQIVAYDEVFALKDYSPSYVGYNFQGWALTAKDGSSGIAKYHPQYSGLKNLASTQDAIVNLYAVWTAVTNYAAIPNTPSVGTYNGNSPVVKGGTTYVKPNTLYKVEFTANGVVDSQYRLYRSELLIKKDNTTMSEAQIKVDNSANIITTADISEQKITSVFEKTVNSLCYFKYNPTVSGTVKTNLLFGSNEISNKGSAMSGIYYVSFDESLGNFDIYANFYVGRFIASTKSETVQASKVSTARNVCIDGEGPAININTPIPTSWTSEDVTLNVTMLDEKSGFNSYKLYKKVNDTWELISTGTTTKINETLTATDIVNYKLEAYDNLNNKSEYTFTEEGIRQKHM